MSPLPSRTDRPTTAEFRTSVMTRNANGLPRTLRLVKTPAQQAAYRRLAVTILSLDVASLAVSLRRAA